MRLWRITNNQLRRSERGITIIENLVAISLLGIVIASSSRFIITTMQSNHSARAYGAIASDIHKIVDGYRGLSYTQLLGKFGSSINSIQNNQTAAETGTFGDGWMSYATTFTAVKSSNNSIPEAVKVHIAATQRRGNLGTASFNYDTYIGQIR